MEAGRNNNTVEGFPHFSNLTAENRPLQTNQQPAGTFQWRPPYTWRDSGHFLRHSDIYPKRFCTHSRVGVLSWNGCMKMSTNNNHRSLWKCWFPRRRFQGREQDSVREVHPICLLALYFCAYASTRNRRRLPGLLEECIWQCTHFSSWDREAPLKEINTRLMEELDSQVDHWSRWKRRNRKSLFHPFMSIDSSCSIQVPRLTGALKTLACKGGL